MLHISDLSTSDNNNDYVHQLHLTIKLLTRLLKVRLRTEFPESYAILNELNEKLLPVIQTATKLSKKNHIDDRLRDLENMYV